MKTYEGFESWNGSDRTAVTLGNFDGVHIGHRVILQRTVDLAHTAKVPAVAVTFDPVPKKVLQPDKAPRMIQTLEQRLAKFESLGLDHAIVVRFSQDFARKTPEEFVREFLIQTLKVQFFVVGENFSFGHQKRGDLSLLRKMGLEHDFQVEGIPEVCMDGARISSSQIRELVLNGRMEEAARFLGHSFSLIGNVVEGEHLGGKLGIPTANLDYENEIVPAKGVYVTRAVVKNRDYQAATNVGVRPTFQGQKLTVEAHLLNFSGDLYDSRLELHFLKKLREEKHFSSVEELKAQILADIENTKNYS